MRTYDGSDRLEWCGLCLPCTTRRWTKKVSKSTFDHYLSEEREHDNHEYSKTLFPISRKWFCLSILTSSPTRKVKVMEIVKNSCRRFCFSFLRLFLLSLYSSFSRLNVFGDGAFFLPPLHGDVDLKMLMRPEESSFFLSPFSCRKSAEKENQVLLFLTRSVERMTPTGAVNCNGAVERGQVKQVTP